MSWIGAQPKMHAGVCEGGQWLSTPQAVGLDSINPTTEAVLGTVHLGTQDQLETVISGADKSAKAWREVPAPKRGELIRVLSGLLRQHKQTLAQLITLEMGKPIQEAVGEIQEMLDMADLAIGQSRMLYGKLIASERPAHRFYEQWHPLGVVTVITAFNFPMAVWAWNAMLAAVCGNTVIWKPSHQTPLCAIAIQQICCEAMDLTGHQGVFSLFIADRQVAQALLSDTRLALTSFTGSTAVGREVNQIVAQRFGRILLELGGNNAVIVDETANIDLAVRAILFGAIGTAGQRCTTTRRVFIHQNIASVFTAQLLSAYEHIRIGDPLDSQYLMGPLVSEAAVTSFEALMGELRTLGAKVLTGGKRIEGTGYFVEPTVVWAEADWPCVQRETFAPVLYLMVYEDFETALALNNGVKQGLSSACFTQNLQCAEKFLAVSGSDCGIANINIGTSGAEIGGSFGGEKETGGGREAGGDAWKAYMRCQTCTLNWGDSLPLAQGVVFK